MRKSWKTTAVLMFWVLAWNAPAEEWPQFRGPTGQGVSQIQNAPTKWSADENVAWKTNIPGQGWSSPVLAGGKIYLTTALPAMGATPLTLRALCIDAANGQTIWDVEVLRPDASRARQVHKKNSLASPTPIIRGGRLYVHFGHMG